MRKTRRMQEEDEELDRAIALSLESNMNSQEEAFFTSKPIDFNKNSNNKRQFENNSQKNNNNKNSNNSSNSSSNSNSNSRLNDSEAKRLTQIHADEEFAKQLQNEQNQQNNSNSSNNNNNNNNGWIPDNIFGRLLSPSTLNSSNGCKVCGKSIQGRYLIVDDQKYHTSCFCCNGCNQPIDGSYVTKEPNEFYHRNCYNELFSQKCDVCFQNLVGTYYTHPFFRGYQNYCQSHEGNVRRCFACSSLETIKEHFPVLPDGRALCWSCIETFIVDSSEAQPLYLEAVDFMETVLGLSIPKGMREVPILAVDLPSLNEQNNIQARTGTSTHPNCPHTTGDQLSRTGIPSGSVTRGLTLTTISEVRYISPGNLLWGNSFQRNQSSTSATATGSQFNFNTIQLDRKCSVTAVLVLCGLPRHLATSILAHEAMHVWCKLRPNPLLDLPSMIEEGLCQYVAFQYLEYLQQCNTRNNTSSSSSSSTTSPTSWSDKLIPYFKHQIETDTSPVYGDGFREVAKCCSIIGLEALLEHLTQTKSLPIL